MIVFFSLRYLNSWMSVIRMLYLFASFSLYAVWYFISSSISVSTHNTIPSLSCWYKTVSDCSYSFSYSYSLRNTAFVVYADMEERRRNEYPWNGNGQYRRRSQDHYMLYCTLRVLQSHRRWKYDSRRGSLTEHDEGHDMYDCYCTVGGWDGISMEWKGGEGSMGRSAAPSWKGTMCGISAPHLRISQVAI